MKLMEPLAVCNEEVTGAEHALIIGNRACRAALADRGVAHLAISRDAQMMKCSADKRSLTGVASDKFARRSVRQHHPRSPSATVRYDKHLPNAFVWTNEQGPNGCSIFVLLNIDLIRKTAVPNSPTNPFPLVWITLPKTCKASVWREFILGGVENFPCLVIVEEPGISTPMPFLMSDGQTVWLSLISWKNEDGQKICDPNDISMVVYGLISVIS